MRARTYDKEKRNWERFDVDISTEGRVIDSASEDGGATFQCRVDNISITAIQFVTAEMLNQEQHVEIKVPLAEGDDPITLSATVSSSKASVSEPGAYRTRVTLLPEGNRDFEAWEAHLKAKQGPEKEPFVERRKQTSKAQKFLAYGVAALYLCVIGLALVFAIQWRATGTGFSSTVEGSEGTVFLFFIIPAIVVGGIVFAVTVMRSRRKTDEKPMAFLLFAFLVLLAICGVLIEKVF